MMTVFHALPWQGLSDRNHNGSFGRPGGKSIENLKRPGVPVKSIQRSS